MNGWFACMHGFLLTSQIAPAYCLTACSCRHTFCTHTMWIPCTCSALPRPSEEAEEPTFPGKEAPRSRPSTLWTRVHWPLPCAWHSWISHLSEPAWQNYFDPSGIQWMNTVSHATYLSKSMQNLASCPMGLVIVHDYNWHGVITCKESPTLMKKDSASGRTETQVPSLKEISSPEVLFDLSTEMSCGSVCSPNPVMRPLSSCSSGHGG